MNNLYKRLRKTVVSQDGYSEYKSIVADLIDNDLVKKMKLYNHHYTSTCYSHSLKVSYYSYCIAKKLGLNYVCVARAGLLHDLFLYDWKTDKNHGRLHGYTHPKKALENAKKITALSLLEQDIIIKHMWPLTFKFPRYLESYVVTFVDKFCASKECFSYFNKWISNVIASKKFARYAYLFLGTLMLRIF